jgi:hypothetical protein
MNISFKSATLFSLLATYASVVHASLSEVTYYFDTEMAADPAAVPSSAGSMSTGTGTVTVKNDGTVTLDIRWELRGNDGPIDNTNALAGIHIHKGDQNTNGPIVFGFCGQDPLPSFGGTCQQGWSYQSAQTATQYAGQICDMAPPAPCYNDGQSTAEEAAQALIDGQEEFYVNIHTTRSIAANGDAGPLGLIRGQLRLKKEARPMDSDDEVASTITRTSREMKSALRGGYM